MLLQDGGYLGLSSLAPGSQPVFVCNSQTRDFTISNAEFLLSSFADLKSKRQPFQTRYQLLSPERFPNTKENHLAKQALHMDTFSPYSDPHPLGSDYWSLKTPETCLVDRASHSDEEALLLSTNPKKRAGRKKFKETRHPIYRGVRSRNSNRWVCELREPNKQSRIWLGTYPTAEMAARAHDVAALALKGHSACLNFADSAWRLPVPISKDAKEIQKTAAEAAEAFRPLELRSNIKSPKEHVSSSSTVLSFETENASYVDEEAVFNMPGLLTNMAEALLLSPPCVDDMSYEDDVESDADMSLWSYSI